MKAKRMKKTAVAETARVGKDEMNLAEFPISILTNRTPEGVKTLRYQDQHGQLTVTGSDALGLPTAIDADVIVALIELTKKRNNFTEQTINFTRYELIRLLDWANVGSSYERVEESLNRWAGVLLMYDGCWWDNRTKSYVSKSFHIIESIIIAEGKTRGIKEGRQSSLPLSSFTWSKDFIQSCKDNNLKDLDTSLYFSLKLPTSKQLFRFLDKRFYRYPEVVFDLAEVAFERVGLSRSYSGNAGKIKEKLGDAIKELETRGFLKPLSRDERYFKMPEGWKIRLIDGRGAAPVPPASLAIVELEPSPLVAALVQRGVTKATAEDLAQCHPADGIEAKIEVFDWLVEKQDKRIAKSPAGYLVKSINDDYATPKGFVSKAERRRREEARQAKQRAEAEQRRRKQEEESREETERQAIAAYWASLSPEQQAALEATVLAEADEASRQTYETMKRMRGGDGYLTMLRRDHIRQILRIRDRVPAEA